MPHSPFTRFFGLAIVLAYALALLCLDDHSYLWGWKGMLALPFAIGIFTWSAVRNAAPFDDLSFHRTLPPGDGFAFRRVLMIHGMVLAGITLAMTAYCWVLNFGWQVMSYGILVLTLPMWALMAANGIATSLSITRQWGKTWGYIAIFVVPVFTATGLYYVRGLFNPEEHGKFYFSAPRAMALTGAALYPLVWWLVSVKRHPVLGFGLGAAISGWMPLIYIYGGFFAVPEGDRWELPVSSHVTIARKADIPAEGKWIAADDVLTISGLRPGEFISHWNFWVKSGSDVMHKRVEHWVIPDDPAEAVAGAVRGPMIAGRFEGERIEWGERAVWNHLRKQIPSHNTFGLWDKKLNTPAHVAFLRPGESALSRPTEGDSDSRGSRPKLTAEEFTSATWQQYAAGVFRLEKVGEIDMASGGTCRLPGGGILKVSTLQREDRQFFISFRHYFENLGQADETWFEANEFTRNWWGEQWVIAVDES